MKQLSKIQTIVFLVGGILMVIGAGSYVFMFQRAVMSVVFLVGALCFALMQLEQRYDGQNVVIIRLRRIQLIADVLFILSGILMIDSHYMLLKPLQLHRLYTIRLQQVDNDTSHSGDIRDLHCTSPVVGA